MTRIDRIEWRLWLLTDACLIDGLFFDHRGLWAAVFMTAVQPPLLAIARGAIASFPSQVRLVFMLMLLAGMWPPLSFLHWIQLAGLSSLLVFDYCLLARILSLAPGNREGPLTWRRIAETFLSAPVDGSFLDAQAARETIV